ncbi:DUF4342 domain-containing protein [Oceanirhabdus sp. W0125-5]|uniref:DUF4342 domain-containing protein n=1 Tax=Oceanirhabdus sp. W0125-5 TaxID=2999116 RepID=UPI0022F2D000|nr:DUF4342 domain-containing protein [Oceanirhabdus sp. W0125-5]WBW95766.1 DUF4342 domain-containing protein [Oceanirhabdus sp. W0125-5]
MAEITLEKIDLIRERTGISYAESRDILILCEGDVIESLIYIENRSKKDKKNVISEFTATAEEFKDWIKETIRKGNVTRIKIKKDDRILVDLPVNAGLAVGMFTLISPLLAAAGIFTAIISSVTIEITKNDGSVEVVNTIIKNVANDIANKVNETAEEVKDKFMKKNCECDCEESEEVNEEVNEEEIEEEIEISLTEEVTEDAEKSANNEEK